MNRLPLKFRQVYGAQLYRKLRAQGWTLDSRGNHFRLKSPDGKSVFCSATPSCPRAKKELVAELTRHGFERRTTPTERA